MRNKRHAGSGTLHGLAVATLLSLVGCSSTPDNTSNVNMGTRDPSSALPESYRETAPPATRTHPLGEATAEELAAQAQRDVDSLRGSTPRVEFAGDPADDMSQPPPTSNMPPLTPPDAQAFNKVEWLAPPAPDNEVRTAAVSTPVFTAEPETPAIRQVSHGETISIEQAMETNRIEQLMIDLSSELYRQSSYTNMPLRELITIAAMSIVKPDRELTAEAIPGLTDREREILVYFQGFFQKLGEDLDGQRDAEDVAREAVASLRTALVETPQMTLATSTLCYRIEGFGAFDEFDRYSFLAHDGQQVIVYLEVEGFTSELNAKSEWVTELSQQLTIYSDHDGIPVWRADWQPAVDVTRNQRQDFFTVQVVTLPKQLSVGKYQLKIRMRDEKSGAEAEGAIEFEMVADSKLAASLP
jgi:hypothetical protein